MGACRYIDFLPPLKRMRCWSGGSSPCMREGRPSKTPFRFHFHNLTREEIGRIVDIEIQRLIENPLPSAILAGKVREGQTVTIAAENEAMAFEAE